MFDARKHSIVVLFQLFCLLVTVDALFLCLQLHTLLQSLTWALTHMAVSISYLLNLQQRLFEVLVSIKLRFIHMVRNKLILLISAASQLHSQSLIAAYDFAEPFLVFLLNRLETAVMLPSLCLLKVQLYFFTIVALYFQLFCGFIFS